MYFLFNNLALGFLHMQSSFDRDNYIEVLYNNISPQMHSQFAKHGSNVVSHQGGSYDYRSVMHYGQTAFSSNGQITMKTKVSYSFFIRYEILFIIIFPAF